QPAPTPGDPIGIGVGTYQALAAVLAAPDAELTLVRVDPAAPYQLHEIIQYLSGDPPTSLTLGERRDELRFDLAKIRREDEELRREKQLVYQLFRDDEESRRRRDEYLAK